MHALFFEVRPHPGHLAHYFDHVALLKPVLARHAGLAFLDRYAALFDSDVLLSHQLWDSEAAIAAWRSDTTHRTSQAAGRHVHFADYRIRVAERVLHWPTGTENTGTENTGPENTGTPDPALAAPADAPHVVALYGAHPVIAPGFAAFDSVNHPGNFVSLAATAGYPAATAMLHAQAATAGLQQSAIYAVRRDYGLHDRAQAPQTWPAQP